MNSLRTVFCLMLSLTASVSFLGAVTTNSKKTSSAKVRHSTGRIVKRKSLYPVVVYSPEVRAAALEEVQAQMHSEAGHFENPEALQPFFVQLIRAQQENTPIRVLQYGDSHTASDDWVDAMRRIFQDSYGAGGPGFALAGRPFKGYRRFDVTGTSSAGWITAGTVGHRGDDRNGLAGVSVTATRPRETVGLTTSSDIVQISYLRQPGGGSFVVSCGGASIETVSTDGPLGSGVYEVQHTPGEHTYQVQTTSYAPVRLFGWVAENERGLSWATFGVNGAQAQSILSWNEDLWKEQVQSRNPALVIVAYGTNEAIYPLFTPEDYQKGLQAVVQKLKEAVPDASILLVGPPSCGRARPFPYLRQVIDIQRQVARETKCAFWDWQSHMERSGGRSLWFKAGLSQPDFTHLTSEGYRLLGKAIADDLLEQLRASGMQPTSDGTVQDRLQR